MMTQNSISPTLLDVPTEFVTENLWIRCPRQGDGNTVFHAVSESLEALRKFPASLPWSMIEPSPEQSEIFCRQGQADFICRRAMPLLVFKKETHEFVGCCGLHGFDWSVPKCSIGYWVKTSFAKKGLMTEAVSAATEFAVSALGMLRVESLPDDENRDSCAVCENAGYVLEGTLKNERRHPESGLRNTRVYAFTIS